ncbi:Transmembrane protein TauE-like [Parasponia andersonii]|uniref:Transmembrane protein TauE-like n=1 Tax=Parasponia andersonii TaxID=3476 RepID=A0A2P5DTA7_PARAD|nr:Transmembrane protein TauE-like [Parasponia andersonii]
MAKVGSSRFRVWSSKPIAMVLLLNCLVAFVFVSGEKSLKLPIEASSSIFKGQVVVQEQYNNASNYFLKATSFLWQSDQSAGYQHVWPEMKLGWQIIIGTIFGAIGAAFGSIGGIGGGGFFVPMLRLIIGFDPKSATAMSKCMIMGAAISTVYYNLKRRHPTLDIPIMDYDLLLLIQPMVMLGISIGVAFSVVFADWMEIDKQLESSGTSSSSSHVQVEYKPLAGGPSTTTGSREETKRGKVTILENLYWKDLGLLVFVWVAFLGLQIAKSYTANCSTEYWLLNLLQIPVSVGVYLYEAVSLYKGRRVIASNGDGQPTNWRVHTLFLFSAGGLFAGIIGGLLGIGGGSIIGPLFLELGVPPQVASATATFGMTFSSSMSVVEYYLLNRFPVPYALYFIGVAAVAAYIGQSAINRLIKIFGRASLIIFVLAFTIYVSTISLGGVGIANMVEKIKRNEYMGFEDLCKYGGV